MCVSSCAGAMQNFTIYIYIYIYYLLSIIIYWYLMTFWHFQKVVDKLVVSGIATVSGMFLSMSEDGIFCRSPWARDHSRSLAELLQSAATATTPSYPSPSSSHGSQRMTGFFQTFPDPSGIFGSLLVFQFQNVWTIVDLCSTSMIVTCCNLFRDFCHLQRWNCFEWTDIARI